MRKLIYIISAVLLLAFASGASAGSCWDDKTDIDDCKVKAEQGDAKAQFNLGVMYDLGKGVAQDYDKAFAWWSKAADRGLAEAQFNLGLWYDTGKVVSQNDMKAFYWYSKAAEQGMTWAQNNVAFMYFMGKGVIRDYEMAYMFATIAGENGNERAVKNRHIVAKKMTSSQIEKAQQLEKEWVERHQK